LAGSILTGHFVQNLTVLVSHPDGTLYNLGQRVSTQNGRLLVVRRKIFFLDFEVLQLQRLVSGTDREGLSKTFQHLLSYHFSALIGARHNRE